MFESFVNQLASASLAEWIGMLAGLAQVVLAWKNKSINFLFGIISVSAFAYLFYNGGLYADMSLNFYYFIISIVGWLNWNKKGNFLKISYCSKLDFLYAVGIAVFSFCITLFILKNYTDSEVPLADAGLSAFAWAGTWLMAKRKLENWLWLNVSNLIAMPLYIYKGFWLTAFFTFILFIVACLGYWDWKKKVK